MFPIAAIIRDTTITRRVGAWLLQKPNTIDPCSASGENKETQCKEVSRVRLSKAKDVYE